MSLLAVDAGTTHCKAALFDEEGRLLAYASRPTETRQAEEGYAYEPEGLWQQVVSAMGEVCQGREEEVAAVGVSSMAETGLLLDAKSGEERTLFIPWFDRRTLLQAEQLRQQFDEGQRFCRTGLRPNYKWALAKLLWLEEQQAGISRGAKWLSVADYLAYRLTGEMATDLSLASRTYAFRIDNREWDTIGLETLGLDPALFPVARAAGELVGRTTAGAAAEAGLPRGTPVTVAGHDHITAAFVAGAIGPGTIFDSMGTAEALIGALPWRQLGAEDYASGLLYGWHTVREQLYWMGGLSTSGGSLEWLRCLLAEPALSYEAVAQLLDSLPPEPTGILYFPYLSGSGSPHSDATLSAAFIGLRRAHGRGHLLKAALEGVAYEMEWIRLAAERVTGQAIDQLLVAGGGMRNRHWLQIKADISGRPLHLLHTAEVTLLGAALLAGLAGGLYGSEAEALSLPALAPVAVIEPDARRHEAYRQLFEGGFAPLQEPLREAAHRLDR